VLHVGKIKVAACRPAEDVENVAARCFEVARRIVACRDIDLLSNNNNNNNNNQSDIYGDVITACHRESSRGSFDECRLSAGGRKPPDQVNQLGL